jgi:hypothetical protein
VTWICHDFPDSKKCIALVSPCYRRLW